MSALPDIIFVNDTLGGAGNPQNNIPGYTNNGALTLVGITSADYPKFLLGGGGTQIAQACNAGLTFASFGAQAGAGMGALSLGLSSYGVAGALSGSLLFSGFSGEGGDASTALILFGGGNGNTVSPIAGGGGGAFVLYGGGTGSIIPGQMNSGAITLSCVAGAGAVSKSALTFSTASIGQWPQPKSWISVLQSPGILEAVCDADTISLLAGALAFSDHASSIVTWPLKDHVSLGTPILDKWTGLSATSSTVTMSAVLGIIWRSLLADHVTFTQTVTPQYAYLLDLADALHLVAGPNSSLAARNAVAASLAIHATTAPAWAQHISDHMTLSASFASELSAYTAALDHATFTATQAQHLTVNAALASTVNLHDVDATTAALKSLLADGIGFSITLRLGDDYFAAWVLNTDTLGATTYQNYAFNSFASVGSRYFGATDTGIYELIGTTDNGANIEAWVRSGLSNLGTGKLKRMPSMYLGYTSAGVIVLKVITTQPEGSKVENWYQLVANTANDVRQSRIKIGRGLRSVYWGYELHNMTGDEFTLRDVQFYPMVIDRRI